MSRFDENINPISMSSYIYQNALKSSQVALRVSAACFKDHLDISNLLITAIKHRLGTLHARLHSIRHDMYTKCKV